MSFPRSNRFLTAGLFLLLFAILASCSTFLKKKTERILARVDDDYLYESEVKGIVPPGSSANDSIAITHAFVDNWVRNRLLLRQAERNLSESQMDFTRQLEDYRNSLVIYAYENALVQQKLDTIVSEDEIEQYYNANQGNFMLKENIVQLQYVKLPLKSPQYKTIKKLLGQDDPASKNKLTELVSKNAGDYFLDDQNWLSFSDVLKEIPIKTYNQEEFLRKNQDLEYQDSSYTYLVRIKDFKIKESTSPLDFERDRIRNIILNKRKLELLNRMQQDIYDKAVKDGLFETY